MTKQKRISKVAGYMLSRIKSRAGKIKYYEHVQCLVSKKDMEFFLTNNWIRFLFLRRKWIKSGKLPKHRVSVDRIDSKKHYSLDNIRLLPLYLNTKYASKGRPQKLETKKKLSISIKAFYQKNPDAMSIKFKESRDRMNNILARNENGERICDLAREFDVTTGHISLEKRKRRLKNKQ